MISPSKLIENLKSKIRILVILKKFSKLLVVLIILCWDQGWNTLEHSYAVSNLMKDKSSISSDSICLLEHCSGNGVLVETNDDDLLVQLALRDLTDHVLVRHC